METTQLTDTDRRNLYIALGQIAEYLTWSDMKIDAEFGTTRENLVSRQQQLLEELSANNG